MSVLNYTLPVLLINSFTLVSIFLDHQRILLSSIHKKSSILSFHFIFGVQETTVCAKIKLFMHFDCKTAMMTLPCTRGKRALLILLSAHSNSTLSSSCLVTSMSVMVLTLGFV